MASNKKITHFKSQAEIDARKAFLAGAEAAVAGDKWDFGDLKRLSTDALLDRLEKVDNQATLMRWRIWWAIRQQFKSDKLFGQYIISLKESSQYAPLIGSQQDINRALNAGKFCEQYGIADLDAAGLLKSSVYALSRPTNADVAGKIFLAAKRKNLPNTEIERMIYEAKSITVLQEPPAETELLIEHVPLGVRQIQVKNNIAQLPEVLETLNGLEEVAKIIDRVDESREHGPDRRVNREVLPTNINDRRAGLPDRRSGAPDRRFTTWIDAVKPEYRREHKRPQVDLRNVDYDDLLLELASRDVSGLKEDQKIAEMLLLDERFKMSAIKLIGLHTNAIRQHQEAVYGKK